MTTPNLPSNPLEVDGDHPLLADLDTFARRLGLASKTDLTQDDLDALAAASARFRSEANHPITVADFDLEIDTDGGNLITLPFRHIKTIEVFGVDGATGDRELLEPGSYEVSRRDGLLRRAQRWPDRLGAIWVTARAGLERIPADIAEQVMNLAEYVLTTDLGVAAMTVGGQNLSWTATAYAAGVTEPWVSAVEKYVINVGDQA